MDRQDHRERKYIGSGRSADVFLNRDQSLVTKVFSGEPVSKFILYVLTGAANPYNWCQPAIETALIRRKILALLCPVWFDDLLRIPQVGEIRWNAEAMAFEMDAEYIAGGHAPLLNPLQDKPADYLAELKSTVLLPLQEKLIETGFDGLVWQAGKGNPVGVSNFMLENTADGHRWVWIDMESGLPALFALNPLSTLFFYLPMCVKHRGWLFDDVDTDKLDSCLSSLQDSFNDEAKTELTRLRIELKDTQQKWKSLTRHQRSLQYALKSKKITDAQYQYFKSRPVFWLLVTFLRGSRSGILGLWHAIVHAAHSLFSFRYRKLFRRITRYVSSSFYRWGVVRWFVKREINNWHSRGFLSTAERRVLEMELRGNEISAYLTDFSIHLGIKPFIKVFLWVGLPIMLTSGSVGIGGAALIVLWTGPVARTVYTIWRIMHSLVKSRSHYPFVALFVGMLPMAGNLAYPMEVLYQSAGKGNLLGRYMTCAFGAKFGSKIPIWGGKDTEIEHFCNRIGHMITGLKLMRRRKV